MVMVADRHERRDGNAGRRQYPERAFRGAGPVLETELGFQATATGRGTAGVGSPSRGTADATVTVEDTTPPELVSAEVGGSGGLLTLTFNEDLDITATKLPPADAFTVKADGVEVAVGGCGGEPN